MGIHTFPKGPLCAIIYQRTAEDISLAVVLFCCGQQNLNLYADKAQKQQYFLVH